MTVVLNGQVSVKHVDKKNEDQFSGMHISYHVYNSGIYRYLCLNDFLINGIERANIIYIHGPVCVFVCGKSSINDKLYIIGICESICMG